MRLAGAGGARAPASCLHFATKHLLAEAGTVSRQPQPCQKGSKRLSWASFLKLRGPLKTPPYGLFTEGFRFNHLARSQFHMLALPAPAAPKARLGT